MKSGARDKGCDRGRTVNNIAVNLLSIPELYLKDIWPEFTCHK